MTVIGGLTCETACVEPLDSEAHWTVPSLAEAVGMSASRTHEILPVDLKPDSLVHGQRPALKSTPQQADVRGLYHSLSENAIVISSDDKTSIWWGHPGCSEWVMKPAKPRDASSDSTATMSKPRCR